MTNIVERRYALSIADLNESLQNVYASAEWASAVEIFKKSKKIFYFGHGGNLAIADHAAVDLTRLTDKLGLSPGSGVWSTSFINDFSWAQWMVRWLEMHLEAIGQQDVCAFIITSSFGADDIKNLVNMLLERGIPTICVTSTPSDLKSTDSYAEVCLNLKTYHDSEVLALGLTYDFIVAAGYQCPKIRKKP